MQAGKPSLLMPHTYTNQEPADACSFLKPCCVNLFVKIDRPNKTAKRAIREFKKLNICEKRQRLCACVFQGAFVT